MNAYETFQLLMTDFAPALVALISVAVAVGLMDWLVKLVAGVFAHD